MRVKNDDDDSLRRARADALANMSSPSTTPSVRVAAVGASTNRARRTTTTTTTTTTKRMQLEERIDEVETTTTRGRGRREVLRIAATCVGMGISSSIGRSGERVARASTPGETSPEDAMLREARARVGRAREDVAKALKLLEPYVRDDDDDDDATSSSSSSEERRTLPLKELNALLATSPAIRALEEDAVVIDALTSKAAPLDDVEKRAWNSVNAEEWLTQSSTTTLPAKRPNDFLCAVFSCYNDPRAPPSTEMLLTLRLAKDGVKMGLRNDARITAGGLTASLTDVLEKMDDYLSLVDG